MTEPPADLEAWRNYVNRTLERQEQELESLRSTIHTMANTLNNSLLQIQRQRLRQQKKEEAGG